MVRTSRLATRWLARIRRSKHVLWLLGVFSFLETIILPVPMELVLVPLMAVDKRRIWALATATTLGCLLASLVGYGVGMVLYQSVGTWFIEAMGMQQGYEAFQSLFERHGFVAILALGILPVPFQIAMITAGLSGYPVLLFALAALIARGLRYYGLGWLVYRFGDDAQAMWQRHAILVSLLAAVVVIAVALLMRAVAGLLF